MGDQLAEVAGPFAAALFEAVAVAVHLQDVDMMGEPVEQSAGQAFGAEDLGPLLKRQIAGDQRGAAFVALAEDLEQQLGAGFRQRHEAQFIDDEQLVGGQLLLESSQIFLIASLDSSLTRAAAVVKRTRWPR